MARINGLWIDPITHARPDYEAVRHLYQQMLRTRYTAVLGEARERNAALGPFCDHVTSRLAQRDLRKHRRLDPYFSTAVNCWMGALARGLEWVRSGAKPALLERYAAAAAFDADVAVEFPSDADAGVPWLHRLSPGIWVRPVEALIISPWQRSRVYDALPGFPGDAYDVIDAQASRRIVTHLEGALELLRRVDPVGSETLAANIHTMFVALIRGRKTTFASRNDCPGTVIVALSEERLERDDRAFTASQLYHEHCHIKLAVRCEAYGVGLPPEHTLISAFKNENRDLETILHTAYTIAAECLVRLALLSRTNEADRSRAFGYLGAVAERLHLTTEALAHALTRASALPDDIGEVVALGRSAVSAIREQIRHQSTGLRELHDRERAAVEERHMWDIGQFLVRGVNVCEPELDKVHVADGTASFEWRGQPRRAVQEPARASFGDYGRYVEGAL